MFHLKLSGSTYCRLNLLAVWRGVGVKPALAQDNESEQRFGESLIRFLKGPIRLTGALGADPAEAWIKFQDRLAERNERLRPIHMYEAEQGWEHRFHHVL